MLVEGSSPATTSSCAKYGKMFRSVYSTMLLIFSTALVMDVIFNGNTKIAKDVHPALAFCLLWVGLIWLAMVEGGQASLVGLPPVDTSLYKDSHPTTHDQMIIINQGDNLDRYLMGRQFLVLALVFLENLCGDAIDKDAVLLGGLPNWVNKVLLGSGLALFFMTAMIGKISAQVNASRCMLDYCNNKLSVVTLQVSRLIEWSGLLHCCYLVQMAFAYLAGQPLESSEAKRTGPQQAFFWARVAVSLGILGTSFAVTLSALFHEQTTMWEGVPSGVAVIFFFAFMAVVGMLEGMQIAFFAVARMPEAERALHPWAKKTCDLLFAGDARNLPGFMVGRQMCVTMCFFIIARVTTIELQEGDSNIFGVSDGVQALFDTGLLGALITTIVASITWQLVASAFPMAFLSTPLTYVLLRFCLFLEWTGLCQGAWIVAQVHRKCAGFQRDEVYIGTAEERLANAAAKGVASMDEEERNVRAGHMYPGVPNLPADLHLRTKTLESIHELESELVERQKEIEARLQSVRVEKEKLVLKSQQDA